jgi:hypothetical protein
MNAAYALLPPVGGAGVVPILYVGASTISAVGTGVLVGALGSIVIDAGGGWFLTILLVVVSLLSVLYGMADMCGWRLTPPTRLWQVPAWWGVYGPKRFAIAFGVCTGVGWATVVPYFGFYLLLVVCTTLASPLHSALIMGVFGFARAFPLVLAQPLCAPDGHLTLSQVHAFSDRLAAWSGARGMMIWRGALLLGSACAMWM